MGCWPWWCPCISCLKRGDSFPGLRDFSILCFLSSIDPWFWSTRSAQKRILPSDRLLQARCHLYWGSTGCVTTPLWPSVGVKPNTSKVGDLESSGTPKCLEFNRKAQNTSHWGVLGVIGKVLERRYRKWPRIGHLDICSPSYGQKKGRESNLQFDSWPLKVGNRPLLDLWIESAIRRWKDLDEGYNFGSDLVVIRLCSRELWAPKVPGLHPGQFRDSNPGVPGKSDIRAWVPPRVIEYTIGSMVVAYSRVRAVSQHPRVSRNVN
jgi:hypothetical protein